MYPPVVTRILSALIIVVAASTAVAAEQPDTSALKRGPRLEDSPGWVPAADPESASVRIGRRLNAPLVKKPFTGGARSLDELGRRVCHFLERPRLDSMMTLTVSEDEFRDILWPEFPQSRPATGLTWQDGWNSLWKRLLNGCNSALHEAGGGYWDFVRFEADTTVAYKNFKLHNGLTLVLRSPEGEEARFNWIRSIAERKGRFKIYSMRD